MVLGKLYGLIDFLIDPDHGLYESIGVHEVSVHLRSQKHIWGKEWG
jgi:hypothetical protein